MYTAPQGEHAGGYCRLFSEEDSHTSVKFLHSAELLVVSSNTPVNYINEIVKHRARAERSFPHLPIHEALPEKPEYRGSYAIHSGQEPGHRLYRPRIDFLQI